LGKGEIGLGFLCGVKFGNVSIFRHFFSFLILCLRRNSVWAENSGLWVWVRNLIGLIDKVVFFFLDELLLSFFFSSSSEHYFLKYQKFSHLFTHPFKDD